MVLTSGNAVFCAGLDITEMYQPDPARLALFWGSLQVAAVLVLVLVLELVLVAGAGAGAGVCTGASSGFGAGVVAGARL